jgi:hypothetical protein
MKSISAAILVLAGAILAAAFVVGTCGLGVAGEPTELGDRVVDYCKQHRGKRVGNGACTILAMAALQSAGANLRGPDDPKGGNRGRDGGFNWGELVFVLERDGAEFKTTGEVKDVRPGDIIQFTNTTLSGPVDDYTSYTMSARHHTAIVSGVQENGTVLKIYHQGANGRKVVSSASLRLVDLQRGRFTIYHPIARTPNESPKKPPMADRPVTPPSEGPPLE